jgi:hypothetical protein
MERRKFLASSVAASALAVAAPGSVLRAAQGAPQGAAQGKGREFYQLRRYHIIAGPQRAICDAFFRDALIPALNRLSISPVGVFDVQIGLQSPSVYILMPSTSAETLATVETYLGKDAEYMKVGAPFLNASGAQPPFDRIESTFLQAFEKWPRLILPAATAKKGTRIFEMRIYEGATDQGHRRKMEMMQSGETEVFDKAGIEQVFYSETLIGSPLPSITYMIVFSSMDERDKKWAAFRASEGWKALSSQPRYSFETINTNVSNYILTPTAYSQI